MPRASWSGMLKLSLVSCPISLSPAASESERVRLNMINPKTGNRISMQPTDAETGERVERSELVRGYEVDKGRYVILTDEELRNLAVEGNRVLELTSFVDKESVDPLFIGDPYFVYPDKRGEEAYRVIAQALENKGRVALGRIVLSTREHPVMLEPFKGGLLMTTLRAADEVRSAEFDFTGKIEPEMVELAESIIDRFEGKWEASKFHDRYQDALRALIEAKEKHLPAPKAGPAPDTSNVIDLMGALRKSLTQVGGARAEAPKSDASKKRPARRAKADQRQRAMLLPVSGGKKPPAEEKPAKPSRRRKAG